MSDLPKGWEAVPSKDGIYYWNTETGEVTWKKPSKSLPPPPPPILSASPSHEMSSDTINNTEYFAHNAYPNYQPVQTCYENVILLESTNVKEDQDNAAPAIPDNRKSEDYVNVDLIDNLSIRDNNVNVSSPSQSLERYQGPGEDQYTCINKVPDRKSNFRHSAVKRKLSNNVEELVITREKIDSTGADGTPDIPSRSSSLYDEMEGDISGDLPPAENTTSQFVVPFSNQYEDVDQPVLLNPDTSLANQDSYDAEQDPLLEKQWQSEVSPEVSNQSRDSGIGLSSSSRGNSLQSVSPLKSTLTSVPNTLYENVELPERQEEPNQLPQGWKQVEYEGQAYYWHVESGVTQWDLPTGQPASLEHAPDSEHSAGDSSHPSSSSLITPPLDPLPDQSNVRNFSAWLVDAKDIDAAEIKHGNCSNIIESCVKSVSDREEQIEQEVLLQVSPGVLRELDVTTSAVNKAYAITRIRAWGCSRENPRYFAYIIRNAKSQAYKCIIYRCGTSAKSLTLALKELSNPNNQESDNTCKTSPNRQSVISIAEKSISSPQLEEEELFQRFNVTYLGSIRVAGDTGIELLCASLERLKNQPANWVEASIDIFASHFRIIETKTGEVLTETRVRFLSFIGLSNDDSMCGYITGDEGTYFCLGFKMEQNCIRLSLTMQQTCEDRFKRFSNAIPDNSTTSSSSLKKSSKLHKAEIAGEKIGGYFKSKVNKMSKQVGYKLQRTSSAKTIYGTYQVQFYGSAQVPMENDKRAVEDAITYLESQSARLSKPYVIEFQITQGAFLFLDKEKRRFTKKIFTISNIRYCLKKGHSVAFVVQNKSGLFEAYAFGEINTSASVIIETIQTAVNENS